MHRQKTMEIKIGSLKIGAGNPIVVQSMTKTNTSEIDATVKQIHELEKAGCQIIRCAVPNKESAEALREIKKQINIPLVADIHFNHNYAIMAAGGGGRGLKNKKKTRKPAGNKIKKKRCFPRKKPTPFLVGWE